MWRLLAERPRPAAACEGPRCSAGRWLWEWRHNSLSCSYYSTTFYVISSHMHLASIRTSQHLYLSREKQFRNPHYRKHYQSLDKKLSGVIFEMPDQVAWNDFAFRETIPIFPKKSKSPDDSETSILRKSHWYLNKSIFQYCGHVNGYNDMFQKTCHTSPLSVLVLRKLYVGISGPAEGGHVHITLPRLKYA